MNPSSLTVITIAKLEPSLAGAEPEFRCQFERLGYFVADRRDHVPGRRPVFNRTVALKDTWAKKQKYPLFIPFYGQSTSILHR